MGQIELKLPKPDEIAQARDALRTLCRLERGGETLLRVEVSEGNSPVTALVPQAAFDAFLRVLQHMSNGEAFSVLPRHAELTTQDAADLLNVSRPHLIKLLDEERIRHRKVGRHRRVLAADLFEYMKRAREESGEALDELAGLSEDLGLY